MRGATASQIEPDIGLAKSSDGALPKGLGISLPMGAPGAAGIQVPATAGELWQGYIGSQRIMVNCPIDYFTHIRVSHSLARTRESDVPGDFQLLESAVDAVMADLDLRTKITVQVEKSIPRGLGMASSTSELAAVLYSLALSCGIPLSEIFEWVHDRVRQLDSGNDGNYRSGLSIVNPATGELISKISNVPKLKLMLVNTGGFVVTEAVDREREKYVAEKYRLDMELSFEQMLRSLATGDWQGLGKASTLNTLLYQKILPKRRLTEVIELAETYGLVGVSSGHTGTVLGLLAQKDFSFHFIQPKIKALFGEGAILGEFNIISGGFYGEPSTSPTF